MDGSTGDIHVRAAELHGTSVGGAEVPGLIDEIAVLAVAATVADGPTTFRDASELAVKETNRIASITGELAALGSRVEPTADGMVVTGGLMAPDGGVLGTGGLTGTGGRPGSGGSSRSSRALAGNECAFATLITPGEI